MKLDKKVCIVTGAGAADDQIGNGRAVALDFASEGAKVLAVDLNETSVKRTVEMIESQGGTADYFVGDLSKEAEAQAMAEAAVERFGAINVLHNNIGVTRDGRVDNLSEEGWQQLFHTNVGTMVNASRACLPQLLESKGSIINVSSVGALRPRGLTAYSTTKGAVITLTQAMAVDYGPQGVRANCIAPGPIYTPNVGGSSMAEDLRERRRKASLLQIEGSPWDVSRTAVFLASTDARYITGVVLPVDGGVSLTSSSR